EARRDYLPDVKVEASGTYLDPEIAKASFGQKAEMTTDISLELSQVIYSYDASKNIQIKKHLAKAEKFKFTASQIDMLYQVTGSYLNALMLQEKLQIAYQDLQLTEQHLEVAKQKYILGQSSKSDVYRLQNQKIGQVQQIITNNAQLQEVIKGLNVQMNNEVSDSITLSTNLLDLSHIKSQYYPINSRLASKDKCHSLKASLVAYVWENTPSLRSIQSQRMALNEKMKIYGKGKWIPTISAYGTYSNTVLREGEGASTSLPAGFSAMPTEMYQMGVKLSYPIFNQNKRPIKRKITKVELQQMESQESYQKKMLEQDISSSILTLKGELQKIELADSNVEISKKSLDMIQENYAQGQCALIEVIDAQNSYIKSKHQSIIAKLDYYKTLMEVEKATGYFFSLHTAEMNENFLSQL
ncbi:TolC family protein, partial [Prolixibacteraceae bacterium]|nr:TolC family protein [Prolixibacteraceae bacterium]